MASDILKDHYRRFRKWTTLLILLLAGASHAVAQAPDDVAELQRQLAAQEAIVREQREVLQKQQETLSRLLEQIDALKQRMGELERASATPAQAPAPSVVEAAVAKQPVQGVAQPERMPSASTAVPPVVGPATAKQLDYRDPVGDLNSRSVEAGTFPGSFVIPGKNVSLAIGGFVKTVAIEDSNAEALGADMLPSVLGTQRGDTEGNFSLDSTITRMFLDARAPAGNGSLRGYIEYDLNATNNGSLGFKLRQAYGSWQTRAGTLTAGHTWSTLMDLKVIPEGLTEPTLSGAIFVRQAQLRWTQSLGEGLKADFAIEDPTGTDVFNNQSLQSRSSVPDFITSIEYGKSGVGHVRFGGIVRRLELTSGSGGPSMTATAWGATMGAHLNTFGKDRLAFSGSYGTGLGRYLLGLGSTAGGVLDPADGQIKLRDNYGGLFWYQHFWTGKLRSTGAFGHAISQTFDRQPGDAFKSTTYTYGNLMWSVLPYMSLGVEYDYGRRTVKDGSIKDNHRVMFGMQVF